MKQLHKQIDYCQRWVEVVKLADQQEKGFLWDANNTFGAVNFTKIREDLRGRADRCRKIKLYALVRLKKSAADLGQLMDSTKF